MAFAPIFMRASDVKIGAVTAGVPDDEATATAYECEVRSVLFTPDASTERVKTLCPSGSYANVSAAEWSVEIGYLVGETDSGTTLSEWLFDHQGEKAIVYFRPVSGGDTGMSAIVTVVAGPYGGEEGGFSEQSVTLPVDGQPSKLAAIP